MLSIESHFQRDLHQGLLGMDSHLSAPYSSSEMDYNDQPSYSAPLHYFDSSTFLLEPPQDASQHLFYQSAPYNAASKASAPQSTEQPPSTFSSASCPSVPSASSSTIGSPYSNHAQTVSYPEPWIGASHTQTHGLGLDPAIANSEDFATEFSVSEMEHEMDIASHGKLSADFVDPSLISAPRTPFMNGAHPYTTENMYPPIPASYPQNSPAPSPTPSHQDPNLHGYTTQPQMPGPFPSAMSYYPQGIYRTSSMSSPSAPSPLSGGADMDEDGHKGRCPHPDCGRVFKDLKAHMLTHQSERPEKCPIANCEYNQKGFARKYDKNRHTLTHYKGTMVCGFCPGSGSSAEKSFNRADVFKRHLTSVHGVEQTPPNSRKRSPTSTAKKITSYCQDATGKCSTCSATFSNAQDFYEHLDECVLRVVQQEEPSEAINLQHLASISKEDVVKETMERNKLTEVDQIVNSHGEEEEDDDDEEDDDEDDDPTYNGRSGKGSIKMNKASGGSRAILGANNAVSKSSRPPRKGLTLSKGGVPLLGKGRKKRRNHYPPSWGLSNDKLKMKKRVICAYDGPRRLVKDDMMLDNEYEVRMKLADGKSYVTDLDVETLRRVEGYHGATQEERGPWKPEESETFNLEELMS